MAEATMILGEFRRTLDARFRLSIPAELAGPLVGEQNECILTKERPGALSLWNISQWQHRIDQGVKVIQQKMEAGRLVGRTSEVQALGRLLSTRHTSVPLAGRGRLVIPEGFREMLGAQPGSDVMVVGAAVCVEIWQPEAWIRFLADEIPEFNERFDRLSE